MLARQPLNPFLIPIIQILRRQSLHAGHNISAPASTHAHAAVQGKTHIILLIHIDLPPIPPNPQLLLLAHLPNLAIMLLIPQRRRRREEERPRDHCGEEWETEGREGVARKCGAVAGGDGVGGG